MKPVTYTEIFFTYIAKVILLLIDGLIFVFGYDFLGIDKFISLPTIWLILFILTVNFAFHLLIHFLTNKLIKNSTENISKLLDEWEEINEEEDHHWSMPWGEIFED